jgi:hypothetical protein
MQYMQYRFGWSRAGWKASRLDDSGQSLGSYQTSKDFSRWTSSGRVKKDQST